MFELPRFRKTVVALQDGQAPIEGANCHEFKRHNEN